MFIAGMFLCDTDTLEAHNKLPRWLTDLSQHKTTFFTALFALSVFLGGVPAQSANYQQFKEQPGWGLLALLKPQAVFDFKWFYLFWAALFFIASVPRLPWLKAFFETSYNQYLAKISFSFYLVSASKWMKDYTNDQQMHGPVLWTLGARMYAAVGYAFEEHALTMPQWVNRFPLPAIGPFGFESNFLACQIILLPLTLWVAELCTKFIDEPSIKFTQWLYNQAKGTDPARSSRSLQK